MKKVTRKTLRVRTVKTASRRKGRKKPAAGRPLLPDKNRRDFRVMLSLTKREFDNITGAAKRAGMHYSPYVRSLVFTGRAKEKRA